MESQSQDFDKDELSALQAWFPPDGRPSKTFREQDIRSISDILFKAGKADWGRIPRIYTTLRIIDQVSAIDDFLSESLSDICFPFSDSTLPHSIRSLSTRREFLDAQQSVLSKGLDLEKSQGHCHFSRETDVPLKKVSELGKGGYGFVDRVQSEVTFLEYARKQIPRGRTFRKDKVVLREFENELNTLKKLSHLHIIKFIGSYTDPRFVGIIMSPVAKCNLKEYLEGPIEPSFVRAFYGCLANAVRFLHENYIRHKDIKPQNILIKGHTVILTDFGISRDWSELGHSTTSGPTTRTPRYSAPEVIFGDARNSSADIWSLGCVFLELWSVLSGRSISELFAYLEGCGNFSSHYSFNLAGIASWRELLMSSKDSAQEPPMWIDNMLVENRQLRWTAQQLVERIQEDCESGPVAYIGLCCDDSVGSPETVATTVHGVALEDASTDGRNNNSTGQGDLTAFRNSLEVFKFTSSTATSQTEESDSPQALNLARKRGQSNLVTPPQSQSQTKGPKRSRSIDDVGSNKRANAVGSAAEPYREQLNPPAPQPKHAIAVNRKPGVKERALRGRTSFSVSTIEVPYKPPNSMILAQENRFTRKQILRFIDSQKTPNERVGRTTRRDTVFEKPLFGYSDHTLPTVIYADSCVKTKPSRLARCTTLRLLAEHMTPATLTGFARYCPNQDRYAQGSSTVLPSPNPEDKVQGFVVFGLHASQCQNLRKFDADSEHDELRFVSITLQDGEEMMVEARVRVWNEEEQEQVVPCDKDWTPHDLLRTDWYKIVHRLVGAEDEALGSETFKQSRVEEEQDIGPTFSPDS